MDGQTDGVGAKDTCVSKNVVHRTKVCRENAVKCREMQRYSEKCREMQRKAEKCRETQRNVEKCREIQRNAGSVLYFED